MNYLLIFLWTIGLHSSHDWLSSIQSSKFRSPNIFSKKDHFFTEIESHDLPLSEVLKGARDESFAATTHIDHLMQAKAFDIVPRFKGSVRKDCPLLFNGSHFKHLNASLIINESKGIELTIITQNRTNIIGSEWLIFMTSRRIAFSSLTRAGTHHITLKGWKNITEMIDVEANGVRIFTFDQQLGPLMKSGWRIMQLVMGLQTADKKTLKAFHEQQLDYVFTKRDEKIVLGLDDTDGVEEKIRSGDILASHILTAQNTFGWYFYGGHVSHISICLRDEQGQLFVVETTNAEFFPDPQPPWGAGFRKTPFRQWLSIYHQHGYAVALCPLKASLSAAFNASAAWEWFETHRQPFATWTFPFIAIDTPSGNIPQDFSKESMTLGLALFGRARPDLIQAHILNAFSMRLFHTLHQRPCHSIEDCIDASNEIGMDIFEIVAIPEDETWVYQNGSALVCSGVVANILRAGGVFGSIAFNPTELTPKDILTLDIFDINVASRISPKCISSLPVVKPYCQLVGEYVLDIQYYNSIAPHDNMYDHCASSHPDWYPTPEGC